MRLNLKEMPQGMAAFQYQITVWRRKVLRMNNTVGCTDDASKRQQRLLGLKRFASEGSTFLSIGRPSKLRKESTRLVIGH